MRHSHLRKWTHLTLISFGIIFLSSIKAQAGTGVWTSLGPDGGAVGALFASPANSDVILAAAGHELFKSSNAGANWKPVYFTKWYDYVACLAADPADSNTFYLGSSGVYKSTNGGESWSLLGLQDELIQTVAVDPTNRLTIYAAGNSTNNFFKSLDGGKSWTSGSFNQSPAFALVIDPKDANVLYLGARDGIFKSTDGGANWLLSANSVSSGVVWALATDPSTPGAIYAGADKGVFKTVNGGTSWAPVNQGLEESSIRVLAVDPKAPDIVYAAGSKGIFKTSDRGSTWTAIPAGGIGTSIYAFAISSTAQAVLYAGSPTDVLRSTDGGASWKPMSSGLRAAVMQALVQDPFDPKTFFAIVPGLGVLRSTDGGIKWESRSNGVGDVSFRPRLYVDHINRNTLYATAVDSLFKTVDAGETWVRVAQYFAITDFAIDPHNPNILFLAFDAQNRGGGVSKSEDGGQTWSDASSGLAAARILALAMDPQKPSTLYVSAARGSFYGGGLYRSEDGGGSWQFLNVSSPIPDLAHLLVDPQDSQILYAFATSAVILKSIDGGRKWTWLDLPLGVANLTSIVLDPNDSRVVYVTALEGINRSVNGGGHWSPLNDGLTDRSVACLTIDVRDPQTLYAGTRGGGMFGLTLPHDIPSSFTVVSPNGGEQWHAGTTQRILWTSTGSFWDVKIEVSLNSGSTYSTITSATADTGLYDWTVPNSLGGTTARIRVSSIDGQVSDLSDGNFAIAAPVTSIRLESPSPGSLVTGLVTVKAAVSGSGTVQQVVFRVDGNPLGQSTTEPFTVQWNSSSVWDGFHELQALALDSAGFVAAESHIRVAVRGSQVVPQVDWILPSSARAAGVGGSFYTTDITIANGGLVDAAFNLKFLGHDADGIPGPEKAFDLGAGQSVTFRDVLQSVFGLTSGYGAIQMTSINRDLTLTSQTSTPGSAGGTFGQSVPVPQEFIFSSFVGSISGVREDPAFRTNLILANRVASPVEVELILLDSDGNPLGTRKYNLPALGMTQISRIVRDLGVAKDIIGATLSLFPADGSGGFFAYASVIDNSTNDPRTLLARTGSSWLLPSSARSAGAGGSFFTTDVTVTNAGVVEALVTLYFLGHDADGRNGPTHQFTLEPRATANFSDVLHSAFGLETGYGAIRLTSANPGVTLQGQTSTPGAGGTFGQSVPAAGDNDLVREGVPRSISAIREDGAFRTNLILSNAVEQPIVVEISLVDSNGGLLGAKQLALPPFGMTQITRVVRELGVAGNLTAGRLQLLTSTPGASFAAYASVIDNVTNDPRTLLPR